MEQDACIATKSVSFRFNLLLSAEEIKRAKNHLNQIWRALKNVNAIKTLATETVDTVETDIPIVAEMNETENTETEELEEKETEVKKRPVSNRRPAEPTIEPIIADFVKGPRFAKKENILAPSVPATQVSADRLFSRLKFILSSQRAQMSESLLKDIMLVRSNMLNDVHY